MSAVVFRTQAVVDRFKIQLFGAQQRVHATLFGTHCFEASLQRVGGVGARGASARGGLMPPRGLTEGRAQDSHFEVSPRQQ